MHNNKESGPDYMRRYVSDRISHTKEYIEEARIMLTSIAKHAHDGVEIDVESLAPIKRILADCITRVNTTAIKATRLDVSRTSDGG